MRPLIIAKIIPPRLLLTLFLYSLIFSFHLAAAKQAKLSDDQIKEIASKRLSKIQASKVEVQPGGVVTIHGTVSSYFEKRSIEEEVLWIRGVNRVENKLIVHPEARIDGQIKGNITSALAGQAWFVPRLRRSIALKVEKNVVTLSGNVEDLREKNQIENLVGAVRGVKAIVNNIAIVEPKSTRTNDSIKKEIEFLLVAVLGEEVGKQISVEVGHHQAILKGRVRSYWEKLGAYHVAESVAGVGDIANLLEID